MPVKVSKLKPEDIDGAVTTIQEAFANDPYNLWVFSDRSKVDLTRNRVSLTLRCQWGIRNALFYVAKDPSSTTPEQIIGTAMWLPPKPLNQTSTWSEWLWDSWEGWKLWGGQVRMNLWYGRGGLNVKRYYIWKERQSIAQKEVWTDPKGYYFLNIITVLPSAQGKGVGRALFEEITKKADVEGVRCYLESSRDVPNMKIYEALGFRFVKGLDCEDDGDICKLFCMVRDPKPASIE